jgi:hypothetical protein
MEKALETIGQIQIFLSISVNEFEKTQAKEILLAFINIWTETRFIEILKIVQSINLGLLRGRNNIFWEYFLTFAHYKMYKHGTRLLP